MSDGELAWKAAKLAGAVLACLFGAVALIIGLLIGLYELLGGFGAGLFYAALLFLLFWLAAAIDLSRKEEREADEENAA